MIRRIEEASLKDICLKKRDQIPRTKELKSVED